MQCPRCGHENASSRAYCERCGTPLNGTEGTSVQVEYKVPPPPPLNGHKVLPLQLPHPPLSPPPNLEDDEVTPTLLAHPESIARPRVGVFSGILYFIGTVIAIFGLLGALTTPGSGTVTGLIGLLLALVVLILSIVF
ncbi:MAG: zinc ribbon domain-containing protein, partial [Chloroflexi bacterium]